MPLLPPLNGEVIKTATTTTNLHHHLTSSKPQKLHYRVTEIPPIFIVLDDDDGEEEEEEDEESSSPLSQQQNRVERAYRFIFDVASKRVRSSRLNFKEISRVFNHPVFHVRMEDFSDLLEEHDFVFNLEFFSYDGSWKTMR